MPITPPKLDDLTYDRAVQELIRRIPQHTPEWTNWNQSDPGITLLQLFAHLAEQLAYRLNRVPEKNHLELLKLLGVTLRPAQAASTYVALLLDDPTTATAGTLAAGAAFEAAAAGETLTFESTQCVDTTPCEVAALATTKNPFLTDLLLLEDGTRDAQNDDPRLDAAGESPDHNEFFSLRWDGEKPKLADMPADPIDLLPQDLDHGYLWLGLNFNAAPTAGFIGVRITLTIQLDDDEQPTQEGACTCGPLSPAAEDAPDIDWLHVLDEDGNPVDVTSAGAVVDTTDRLTRSGAISFIIPAEIAAPSTWPNLRDEAVDPVAVCRLFGPAAIAVIDNRIGTLPTAGDCAALLPDYVDLIRDGLEAGADAIDNEDTLPQILHTLAQDLRQLPGWLRITLAQRTLNQTSPRLRITTFNAVPVVNRTTVTGEILGVSDGASGQTFQLRNTNIQSDTLDLQIQEGPQDDSPLVAWTPADLDSASPTDRVFALDPEAGTITFGDGRRGRIPPAVPGLGRIIARAYAHGGGAAGNVPVAAIESFSDSTLGITSAVNPVAATGGKDAEPLDDAKVRARRELATRSRAVTASDFEFIAAQTPGVNVARAVTVPLRSPLTSGATLTPVTAPICGDTVPTDSTSPAGLASFEAPGVVSVIVIPDEPGPEPTPTPSFRRAVCDHLDGHRLVTTEIYVIPPQYCRLCDVQVDVTSKSGFTRAMLQEAVAAHLERYLHVLTGGADGDGFGFGRQLLAPDLIAQIFTVEGIAAVRGFQCRFVRTKSDASPRQGTLRMCPDGDDEFSSLNLAPEETVSIVPSAVALSIVL